MLVFGFSYDYRNLHGKRWFPANVYFVTGLQSENKRPIIWQIKHFFREGRISATLGNPWTYLKQGWYCKAWKSIILWNMELLTLSYHLQYVKRLVTYLQMHVNVKQADDSLTGQCEHNTFETSWDKHQNFFGMKLATDVTLLFLSVADSDIFV